MQPLQGVEVHKIRIAEYCGITGPYGSSIFKLLISPQGHIFYTKLIKSSFP